MSVMIHLYSCKLHFILLQIVILTIHSNQLKNTWLFIHVFLYLQKYGILLP